MTVNELLERLNNWKVINSECGDYEIVMAGYDANGERQYSVPATTIYPIERAQKCVLWDN